MGYPRPKVDRESRSIRRVDVFVHRQDGREIAALLTNISSRGVQLKTSEEFCSNELVHIDIPRLGGVAARIRWASDGFAGAELVPHSDVWEVVLQSSDRNR